MQVPGISRRPQQVPQLGSLTLQVGTVIALTIVLVVNGLANSLPIAGTTTQEVAEGYREAFAPAGYAFTIWSMIYAGLFAYVVFQALPEQRTNQRVLSLAPWFWLSCVANVAWLFLWHYRQISAALVVILLLFACLAGAYYVLHRPGEKVSSAELWCVHVPFSLYFGWVTVATLANLTIWSVHVGLEPAVEAPHVWAVLTIGVGTVIAAVVGWAARDAVYLAAVLWAFIAIVVRHGVPHPVSTAALGAAVIVTAVLVRALYLNGGNVEKPLSAPPDMSRLP